MAALRYAKEYILQRLHSRQNASLSSPEALGEQQAGSLRHPEHHIHADQILSNVRVRNQQRHVKMYTRL